MKKMEKSDKIGLGIAYLGCMIQCWWGIWSYGTYGIPFCNWFTFVRTLGGIIGI